MCLCRSYLLSTNISERLTAVCGNAKACMFLNVMDIAKLLSNVLLLIIQFSNFTKLTGVSATQVNST